MASEPLLDPAGLHGEELGAGLRHKPPPEQVANEWADYGCEPYHDINFRRAVIKLTVPGYQRASGLLLGADPGAADHERDGLHRTAAGPFGPPESDFKTVKGCHEMIAGSVGKALLDIAFGLRLVIRDAQITFSSQNLNTNINTNDSY